MKSKKSKADRSVSEGKFKGSLKRWWQDRSLEASEPPCFQRWQFDSSMGRKGREPISSRALGLAYGDKSLEWHVGGLLIGIHEEIGIL